MLCFSRVARLVCAVAVTSAGAHARWVGEVSETLVEKPTSHLLYFVTKRFMTKGDFANSLKLVLHDAISGVCKKDTKPEQCDVVPVTTRVTEIRDEIKSRRTDLEGAVDSVARGNETTDFFTAGNEAVFQKRFPKMARYGFTLDYWRRLWTGIRRIAVIAALYGHDVHHETVQVRIVKVLLRSQLGMVTRYVLLDKFIDGFWSKLPVVKKIPMATFIKFIISDKDGKRLKKRCHNEFKHDEYGELSEIAKGESSNF